MRTTIILPAVIMAAAVRRQKELKFSSLGKYLEALVRDDYRNRTKLIGAHYEMPELTEESAPFVAKEELERQKDLKAKQKTSPPLRGTRPVKPVDKAHVS